MDARWMSRAAARPNGSGGRDILRTTVAWHDPPSARALVTAASLVPLWKMHALQAETPSQAAQSDVVPYSASKLAALRAEGRVVFVDMTADWCVTCKANEKAVLDRDEFRASMRQANAVFMQGDWTNVDPQITEFLEAHHAVGVPLYVVFPSNGGDGEVLPTVLTQAGVAQALTRARR